MAGRKLNCLRNQSQDRVVCTGDGVADFTLEGVQESGGWRPRPERHSRVC